MTAHEYLPDPRVAYSDSRAEVEREVRKAEEHNIAIEAAMDTAQAAGDDDAYEAAAEAFDAAYKVLVALEGRLLELEDRDARKEEVGRRAWFQWASL